MLADKNPFRASRIECVRYRIAEGALHTLAKHIEENSYCGAIRGPHGTGKSTLLEDLRFHFEKKGFKTRSLFIHRQSSRTEKHRAISSVLDADDSLITFLDGGEVLGLLNWMRLAGRIQHSGLRVLATVHYPCLLATVFRTSVDKALMFDLVQELAGDFWSSALESIARQSFDKNNGNIREVFRACYIHLSGE